mmetsp:Transcript_101346/g.124074  ORF Transcript_101346/g.124074 Transcript_101346/m.124074 type:complete len:121 (-) Transcript_101346:94-456(-)
MSDEHDLYCYCPACSVRDQKKASYWNHSRCKKRSVITQDALVGCKGNDAACKRTKFVDCYWKCANHRNEFKSVSMLFMTTATISASRAVSRPDLANKYDFGVFDQILDSICEQLEQKFSN